MEPFTWWLHRYVMHGILWDWHKDHHEDTRYKTQTWFVNDLFPVIFSFLSIFTITLGVLEIWPRTATLSINLGAMLYGIAYSILHEEIIHQRFGIPWFQIRHARDRVLQD